MKTPPAKIKKELLGPVALALLPTEKLKDKSVRGVPFEREIHDYLVAHFNGYTVSSGNISGHWTDDSGHDHYGEHREYKVALNSPEKRSAFEEYFAHLAHELGEDCIYVELGAEIYLIYAARVEHQPSMPHRTIPIY